MLRYCALFFTLLMTTVSAAETVLDQVTLQATAATPVANDTMAVTLLAQAEAGTAREVASAVNRAMTDALKVVKRNGDGIEFQTGNYSVSPIYSKGMTQGWRGRQELRLTSGDVAGLAELVGELQSLLQTTNMHFFTSDAVKEAAEKRLTDEAIARFRQKAEQIQRAFGARGWRLGQVHVNSGGQAPRPLYAARMEMRSADVAPAVEAGESELSVTVSGSILLLR